MILKAYFVRIFYTLIIYKNFSYKSLINTILTFAGLNVSYLYFLSILTKNFLFLKRKSFVKNVKNTAEIRVNICIYVNFNLLLIMRKVYTVMLMYKKKLFI